MPPLDPPTGFTVFPTMAANAGDLFFDWRYTRGAVHPDNVVTWNFTDPEWQVLGTWHGVKAGGTESRSAQLSVRYFETSGTFTLASTTVQSGPATTIPLLSTRAYQGGLADVVNWRVYVGEELADVEQVHLTGAPWAGDYAWATAAGLNVNANGTFYDTTADHEVDDTGVWTGGVDSGGGVPNAFRATADGSTPIAVDPSPLLGPYGRSLNPDPPPEFLVTAGPWFLWLLAVNGRPGRRRGFGMIKSPR